MNKLKSKALRTAKTECYMQWIKNEILRNTDKYRADKGEKW